MTFKEIKIGDFFEATGGHLQKYMILDKMPDKARIVLWGPGTQMIDVYNENAERWNMSGFIFPDAKKLKESGGQFFLRKIFTGKNREIRIK